MKYVICKQDRALKGRILSTIVLIFAALMLFFGNESLASRTFLFIGSLLVFGFSVSYRINEDFNNQKLFSVFGIVLFKTRLLLEFPEYISVFSASFSLDNDWGAIGALGTKERHEKMVVRFFKENKKITLYKTDSYQKALKKANALSTLLDVEVYDSTKE